MSSSLWACRDDPYHWQHVVVHVYGTFANMPYYTDDLAVHAADSSLAPAQTNLFVTTNQKKLEIMNQVMISPRKIANVSKNVKTPMDIIKMNRKSIVSVFVNYRKIPAF